MDRYYYELSHLFLSFISLMTLFSIRVTVLEKGSPNSMCLMESGKVGSSVHCCYYVAKVLSILHVQYYVPSSKVGCQNIRL